MGRLVLVVEDDWLIRMNAEDALTSSGFEVIGLANGDDALRVIKERPDVMAIFTDINMPGNTDGLTLVKIVADVYPSIALFVASGRAPLAIFSVLPQGAKFYQKPYDVAEVIEAIKALAA
jgi:DNA-binding NtrC family response regulator